MIRPAAALALGVWLGAGAGVARAQNAPVPFRFELSAGAGWSGTTSFGEQRATLTPVSGDPFVLFTTSSELASAADIEAGFAVALSPNFSVHALASYGRPMLRTEVGDDAEGAADVSIEEQVRQFAFTGGVRWHFTRSRMAGGVPFVAGGVGYLRELHDGDTLAVNGQTLYGGAGLDVPLRAARGGVRAAIRAEGRALVRMRGVALDDDLHIGPAAAVSFFVRF